MLEKIDCWLGISRLLLCSVNKNFSIKNYRWTFILRRQRRKFRAESDGTPKNEGEIMGMSARRQAVTRIRATTAA